MHLAGVLLVAVACRVKVHRVRSRMVLARGFPGACAEVAADFLADGVIFRDLLRGHVKEVDAVDTLGQGLTMGAFRVRWYNGAE